MRKTYIMIGLPRSGKSTWIRSKITEGEFILSADRLRKKIYGQRFFKGGEDFVWAVRKVMLKELLDQGMTVYIDETNTTRKRRKKIIEIVEEYDYEILGVIKGTSKEECLERCKRISEEEFEKMKPIIERMSDQFEVPTYDEGFDILSYV